MFHGSILSCIMKTTKQIYQCHGCNKDLCYAFWQVRKRIETNSPIRCRSCANKYKHKQLTTEQKNGYVERGKILAAHLHNVPKATRIQRARKAGEGNRNNDGLAAKRQWENTKANPEKYSRACERLRQTALNFHESMSPKQKEAYYKKVFSGKSTSKVANSFLAEVETVLNISISREVCLHGFFVDGYVPEKDIILEFYGDVFHCNPEKFKDENQYCSWVSRTVGEQWKRDERRIAGLLKNNHKVVIIWETQWNKDKQGSIERIHNEMYKN